MCTVIKKRKVYLLIYITLLIFFFIFVLPYFGYTGSQTKRKKFDVIIVLGAPATNECTPSLIMRQRVSKGIELLNEGMAKKIIFTGGSVANDCVEANIMSKFALTRGVSDGCIIIEPKARNTYQNAFFSVEIMKQQKFKSAAVITSEFHEKRASAIFSNYDIEYQLFVCDNPPIGINYFIWRIRENIILSFHSIIGYPSKFGIYGEV